MPIQMKKIRLTLHQYMSGNDGEDIHRRRLFVLLALSGMVFLVGFGLLNLLEENPAGGWVDITAALILLAGILGLHHLTNAVVVYRAGALLLFSVICFSVAAEAGTGERTLWLVLYPLILFLLLGRKEGLIWSGALFILIGLLVFLDTNMAIHILPVGMTLRLLLVSLTASLLAYAYVSCREISRDNHIAGQVRLDRAKEKPDEATPSAQAANKALLKSEALLKYAQSIAHLGNWEYDYKSRTFWFSEELFTIFGLRFNEHNCSLEVFRSLVPDFNRLQARMARVLKKRRFLDIEFMARRQNDSGDIYLHARAELTRNERGQASKLTGVVQDITDRKTIEAERRELRERLARSRKMEALGLLAGGVAHDLNNVMLGIVSYPDLLLSRMNTDDPLYKPLKKISESGQKAAAIVEDLLTLARRGVTTTEVLNFNAVVKDYLQSPEFMKLQSLHNGVRFFSKLDSKLLNLRGSALHLKKTVMNLVSNAAEAIEGRGTVLISTSNCYVDRPIRGYSDVREGDYVLLCVEDDGMGIDPKDIGQVFEPFYTNKIMGRSGTGLGMAVVWGAVQDHHGYIDVQSSPEIGTRIHVYLPITRESHDLKAEAHPRIEIRGRGESILIVDDVAEQREIASQILEGLGYTVEAVESGEAALDWLKKNRAALLVLDMIMDPGMDGLETYRAIQAVRPGQKAIIVSGYSETGRVKAAQTLGAGAYLKKPYVLETLGRAVRTELDR